jgi:hypothetical protein
MSARGPGAFYVNVDDDGALVLRASWTLGPSKIFRTRSMM